MRSRSLAILVELVLVLWFGTPLGAQPRHFAGSLGGVSTLSADGQTEVTSSSTAAALYRPFNGFALNAFYGVHVTEFVALQANYVRNSNDVTVFMTRLLGREDLLEQDRGSSQDAAIGDMLLYFRNRSSRIRPYLSVGGGAVRLRSESARDVSLRGSPSVPPRMVVSTSAALRVAVGIDLQVHRRWGIRYSFSETLRNNALSRLLTPPGERNLANFQNLFGAYIIF